MNSETRYFRRGGEQGVLAVLLALLLSLLLGLVFLILNLSTTVVIQRELQLAAAASAEAGAAQMCPAAECFDRARAAAVAVLGLHTAHTGFVGNTSLSIDPAQLSNHWDLPQQNLRVTIERGIWDFGDKAFYSVEDAAWQDEHPGVPQALVQNSVRVTVERPSISVAARLFGPSSWSTKATATAVSGDDKQVQVAPFAIPACALVKASGAIYGTADPKELCAGDRLFTATNRYNGAFPSFPYYACNPDDVPAGTQTSIHTLAAPDPWQTSFFGYGWPGTHPWNRLLYLMPFIYFYAGDCPASKWLVDQCDPISRPELGEVSGVAVADIWRTWGYEDLLHTSWTAAMSESNLRQPLTPGDYCMTYHGRARGSGVQTLDEIRERSGWNGHQYLSSLTDHFGVVGLPGNTPPTETDVIDGLTLNPEARIGADFRVLAPGLTEPASDAAMWNAISRSPLSGRVGGRHVAISESIVHTMRRNLGHFYTGNEVNLDLIDPGWGPLPAYPPEYMFLYPPNPDPFAPLPPLANSWFYYEYTTSQDLFFNFGQDNTTIDFPDGGANGICNSHRAAYTDLQQCCGNWWGASWNVGRAARMLLLDADGNRVPANSTTAVDPDNDDNMQVWRIPISVIADYSPNAQSCQGLNGTTAPDPEITSSPGARYKVIGFVEAELFDVDIGNPPPGSSYDFYQTIDRWLPTRRVETWHIDSVPGWAFQQNCNLVRARLTCMLPYLPSSSGRKERPRFTSF